MQTETKEYIKGKKMEITARQEEYLRANANRMSNHEMAQNLDVSDFKITTWIKELQIEKTRESSLLKVLKKTCLCTNGICL